MPPDSLRSVVWSYLNREITIGELSRATDAYIGDPRLRGAPVNSTIYGAVRLYLSEHSYGHRSEEDVRRALRIELRERDSDI